MKAFRLGGLLVLLIVAAAFAADSPTLGDFKSLSARSAADTYAGAVQRLTREFKEKNDAARKTCIQQLGVAQQAATKAGNLDEAIKIRDAITRLNTEIADNAQAGHGATGLIAERQKLSQALAGTVWQSGDTKLKFNEDGTGNLSASDKTWEWVAINGREAYVRYASGWTNRLEFDDSVKTFSFLELGNGKKVEASGGKRIQ
ncbi:MAG TPA: hypothetical protein VFE47_21590 [Tepidisphaeraceae bacterium]|jgi:hypothetical protein|nr:hypothetical protein [Tepidisphaeraceae bacterium]